jgi:hypothetical protein
MSKKSKSLLSLEYIGEEDKSVIGRMLKEK